MATFPDLLDAHREILFIIVKLAESEGAIGSSARISALDTGKTELFIRFGAGNMTSVAVDWPVFEILDQSGYVRYERDKDGNHYSSYGSVILTHQALAYYRLWHRPKIYRIVTVWWIGIEPEVRGAIIAALIGLAGIILLREF